MSHSTAVAAQFQSLSVFALFKHTRQARFQHPKIFDANYRNKFSSNIVLLFTKYYFLNLICPHFNGCALKHVIHANNYWTFIDGSLVGITQHAHVRFLSIRHTTFDPSHLYLFPGICEALHSAQRNYMLDSFGRCCRLRFAALQSSYQVSTARPCLSMWFGPDGTRPSRSIANLDKEAGKSETFRRARIEVSIISLWLMRLQAHIIFFVHTFSKIETRFEP